MMLMSGVSQSGTQRVEMLLFAVVAVGQCTQQLEWDVLCGAQPVHQLCSWSDDNRAELWLCKC